MLACASASGDSLKDAMKIYHKAMPVERAAPHYPERARARNNEGWVILSFVVDEQGSPNSPIVVESAGSDSFERAAARALMKSTFKPATLNGEPIESCDNQYKYTFAMSGKTGASKRFISQYNRGTKLLEQGDLTKVKEIIDQLPNQHHFSHYEDNWLQWLTALYYAELGDGQSELIALKKGFAYNDVAMTTPEVYRSALWRIAELSLSHRNYSDALDYSLRLQAEFEKDEQVDQKYHTMQTKVSEVIDQLNGVEKWVVEETVGDRGFFQTAIIRPQFTLVGDTSDVNEVQLRCDAKRLEMPLEGEITVDVPKHWGSCDLFVHGSVGATLTVVQQVAS